VTDHRAPPAPPGLTAPDAPAPDAPADPPGHVDVLIVGGGPAGLSAATWLGRHRRRTLLVDAGEHRNRWVEHVHGLLANDPVTPTELHRRARADLEQYPHVTVMQDRVTSLRGSEGCFVADVESGRPSLSASRVLLATGVRDEFPNVARFEEHYGADVFHCPTCEGFDARERDVVVLGWGPQVPAFATGLLDWAASVTLVTDGPEPRITAEQRRRLADFGIELVEGRAEELVGERGALRCVRLADGRELPATMAFFSIAHEPTLELASGLGCARTDEGVLAVDEHGLTSVPGVYAAGDITPGMQLVAVAVGKGTIAGVAAALSLQGERTAPDAPDPAPDPQEVAPPGESIDLEDEISS
jgi:thioredoxin reductase